MGTLGREIEMPFLPELTRFLAERGKIRTLRKYKYLQSEIAVRGVGYCHRTFLKEVNSSKDLTEEDVSWSGFADTNAWWKKAKSFTRGYVGPIYLYEVTYET